MRKRDPSVDASACNRMLPASVGKAENLSTKQLRVQVAMQICAIEFLKVPQGEDASNILTGSVATMKFYRPRGVKWVSYCSMASAGASGTVPWFRFGVLRPPSICLLSACRDRSSWNHALYRLITLSECLATGGASV